MPGAFVETQDVISQKALHSGYRKKHLRAAEHTWCYSCGTERRRVGFTTNPPALGAEFDSMAVTVACVRTATTEGNRQVAVYNLTATANGGGGGYPLQRQVQATVSRCTDPEGAAPRFACP
jgi:hypothetical protein